MEIDKNRWSCPLNSGKISICTTRLCNRGGRNEGGRGCVSWGYGGVGVIGDYGGLRVVGVWVHAFNRWWPCCCLTPLTHHSISSPLTPCPLGSMALREDKESEG